MRLLNTSTYELHDSSDPAVVASPHYAILSHRWQPPEVTLQALNPADLRRASLTPQLNKIKQACAVSRQRVTPIQWLWIDTCCIDKTNAVEEARSINSMFSWYRNATVCLTYLYDVDASRFSGQNLFASKNPNRSHLKCEWLERGWTLQELLAPKYVEFYDGNWKLMGTKGDLADELESATGISRKYLTGEAQLESASVANRMSWMAGRTTTMIEDIAYSMLGILGVYMSPQYGEGVNAFMRLQRTLVENSTDESIFAWTAPLNGLMCYRGLGGAVQWEPESWGLLAPSPDCFPRGRDIFIINDKVRTRLGGGYRWTQYGISFEMPAKPGGDVFSVMGFLRNKVELTLNCWVLNDRGSPRALKVHLVRFGDLYHRICCSELGQGRRRPGGNRNILGKNIHLTKSMTVAQPNFNGL